MARISLKEQYDNKDVITQIYDIRDLVEKANDTADTAESNSAKAETDAADALSKITTAVTKADAAQATADAAVEKNTELETALGKTDAKVVTNTTDISQLKISDAEHTTEISTLQSNVSTHATEITAIKAKDVQQDSSIQGLTESVVSDLTGSFDNLTRTLSLSIERESATSIDMSVVIPSTSETGTYSPGPGIAINNNAITAVVDGSNIKLTDSKITLNTDTVATKTYALGVFATKSSVENIASDMATKQAKVVSSTGTLTVSGWSNNVQVMQVEGMTADAVVLVSPAPAYFEQYGKAGIYASAQGDGTVTFKCTVPPTVSIDVNIGRL